MKEWVYFNKTWIRKDFISWVRVFESVIEVGCSNGWSFNQSFEEQTKLFAEQIRLEDELGFRK